MSQASADPPTLYALRIETVKAFAPVVEAGLELLGRTFTVWQDEDRDFVRFEEYAADPAEAEAARAALAAALGEWSDGEPWHIAVEALPREDWSQSWKRFFHTRRVSERIVVRPSWEPYEPRPGDCLVQIDPGMSFGTGLHATTRACLAAADRAHRDGARGGFLDVGCGSGILAIAAAKLGFAPVVAFDNDPVAVETTRENAARNAVADRVDCRLGDALQWTSPEPYDVVAANLLAGVLQTCAARLVRLLAPHPGARLVLAGILDAQYPEVRACYESLGLREHEVIREDEWTTGVFRRPGTQAQTPPTGPARHARCPVPTRPCRGGSRRSRRPGRAAP